MGKSTFCAICQNAENGPKWLGHKITHLDKEIFHEFHENCLIPWLKKNEICIFCKKTFKGNTLKEIKRHIKHMHEIDLINDQRLRDEFQRVGQIEVSANQRVEEIKDNITALIKIIVLETIAGTVIGAARTPSFFMTPERSGDQEMVSSTNSKLISMLFFSAIGSMISFATALTVKIDNRRKPIPESSLLFGIFITQLFIATLVSDSN
ncbi:MAG: hypothetical protein WCJ72_18050 [Chryseobacterium sp.]